MRSPHAPELFVTAPSTTAVARRGADAVVAGEDPAPPEVSVVIPCLNEAEALGTCIESAAAAMREHGIDGEIIVADNGSFDESRAIAHRMGAVVVDVAARGYGSALMAGIAAARGRYVVMGDADASHQDQRVRRPHRPKCRSRSTPMAAPRTCRTSERFGTVGGRSDSSCSAARGGCFSRQAAR